MAMAPRAARSPREKQQLLVHARDFPRLSLLGVNPLLLRCLCIQRTFHTTAPEERPRVAVTVAQRSYGNHGASCEDQQRPLTRSRHEWNKAVPRMLLTGSVEVPKHGHSTAAQPRRLGVTLLPGTFSCTTSPASSFPGKGNLHPSTSFLPTAPAIPAEHSLCDE